MTDASGNEKESMKNHRVTHASPPCITRSLFHMVYVQNPPTCTTNPPSRSAPHSDLHLLPQQKPATQQRPTQHPAKQAQGRTGNPTQRQERTKAHDLTCTHLHPGIPTKSLRSTQVHAQQPPSTPSETLEPSRTQSPGPPQTTPASSTHPT